MEFPTEPVVMFALDRLVEKYPEAEIVLEKALFYMKEINPAEWGEAYSGDNSKFYKKGRDQMLDTIRENLWKVKSITQKQTE